MNGRVASPESVHIHLITSCKRYPKDFNNLILLNSKVSKTNW